MFYVGYCPRLTRTALTFAFQVDSVGSETPTQVDQPIEHSVAATPPTPATPRYFLPLSCGRMLKSVVLTDTSAVVETGYTLEQ
jgi:hypothetical protein